jgi:hypothetical protein
MMLRRRPAWCLVALVVLAASAAAAAADSSIVVETASRRVRWQWALSTGAWLPQGMLHKLLLPQNALADQPEKCVGQGH